MASKTNPLFNSATAVGKLFQFLLVSGICGVLVASFFTPAAAVAGAAASGSINLFNELPTNFNIQPPAQASKILASDGSTIATFYSQNRTQVNLDQMSPYIKTGIVSIEDARFYQHGGVDPTGILRALVATAGGGREGASTITQQYVNNVLIEQLVSKGDSSQVKLGDEKTVGDKVREMKLAIALEKQESKSQILQGYLNLIYFGNGAYGIQAAAKLYFNVSAADLTLPQAAALAGVVNSPTYYDPLTEPTHVVTRRNEVMQKMLQQKKITQAQYSAAIKTPLTLHVSQPSEGCVAANSAPYFCDYVQQTILNDSAYGATVAERTKFLYQGGLTIHTTLNAKLQKIAQTQVDASMSPTDPLQRGSDLVSVQPGTGNVLTMAQNTNYNPVTAVGNYMGNFALPTNDSNGQPLDGSGGFQIGSTFKPFVFAQWLNSGHSMNTQVNAGIRDYPPGYPWVNSCGTTTGTYDPASGTFLLPNDDPNHYFEMTALYGLYQSINTATFQTATQLDFCDIQKMATAAGVFNGDTNKPYDVSTIASLIGTQNVAPISMADAFATFAAGGIRCEPIALVSITDSSGKNYPVPSANCQRTMSADVAAGVTYALKDVLSEGSGYEIPVDQSHDIFAKTGTTDGNTMTWTVGSTSGIATASWFGSYKGIGPQWVNQNITINGKYYDTVDGSQIAGGQWAAVMNAGEKEYSNAPFAQPPASMLAQTPPLVAATG